MSESRGHLGWPILVVLVVLAAAGCSGSAPTIEPPHPSPAALAACQPLLTALPEQVSDQSGLVNAAESVAYWGTGKDAIILRCGVTDPTGLQQDSRCDVVNGIGWYSEHLDDGYRFTTIGRAANVEVTVPGSHSPEADVLNQLTEAVTLVPEVKPCV